MCDVGNDAAAVRDEEAQRLGGATLEHKHKQRHTRAGRTGDHVTAASRRRRRPTFAAALHMSATILPDTHVSKMLEVAKL